MALAYLSDYSSLRDISKDDYQLVGITCLWIASKYEEIYPPRTKNYIEVTADTYTLSQLKRMEGDIVEALEFNLNRTTSLQLLEACSENLPDKAVSLSKYLLELALLNGTTRMYSPYTIVMSALALCESVLKMKFNLTLESSKRVPAEDLKACHKELCVLLASKSCKYDLQAVRKKYGKSRYMQVSKLKLGLQ